MSDIKPTVVEIRCPCRHGFSIRTIEPKKQRMCSMCLRAYIVRAYPNGAVTVHYIDPGMFAELPFDKQNYSIVTEGE